MQAGTAIDIVIIALCAFFALRGLFAGFVHEVMSLLAFVSGYCAVVFFNEKSIAFLQAQFRVAQPIALIVSSVLLFIFGYVIVKFIGIWLSRFVNLIMLNGLNKLAGCIAGALKGAVIVLLLVYVIRVQPIFLNLDALLKLDESRTLPLLQFLYMLIPAIRF